MSGRARDALRRVRRAAGAALLFVAGCTPGGPPAAGAPAPDPAAALARTVDSLRVRGEYARAAAVAARRSDVLRRAPRTAAWLRADAERAARTLRRIAALPAPTRADLARADAAVARADSLLRDGAAGRAVAPLEAALATRRRWLGREHPETLDGQSLLARALLASGLVRRAGLLDRETLRARRRLLGEHHPKVAESLDQLAVDLKSAGSARDESMALYQRAYALRRELLGPGSPEALETLAHIGNLYRVTHRADSALAVLGRVLDASRGSGAADAARAADALFAMAMTVAPRGEWARAEPWLAEAVARWRAAGAGAEPSLARGLASHGLALRHLGRLAEAEAALRESVRWFEDQRRAAPHGWTRTVLYPLVSYDLLAAVQLEQGHGEAAWASVERGLARALLEDLSTSGAVDTTGWWNDARARVQRALGPDEALVGWLTVRPGAAAEEYPFWCYAIRARGPVYWRRMDAPPGGESEGADARLFRLRRELVRAAAWPLRVPDAPAIQQLARAAYAERLAPLEPALAGVRRLVVVSPDLLHGVPVETLRDDHDQLCGERFVVSYAPSALLFARSRATETGRVVPARWRALLAGDPSAPGVPGGGSVALGAARDEVLDLSARFAHTTLLVGADASASRLDALARADSLAGYQLVHVAAHAGANETWTSEPAIAFAAPTGRAHAADGVTASQISARWRLDADLVTLAGCETALGPASKTEGMIGLQTALLGAGARHLLVSAWRVDDRATALLLGRFYDRLLVAPHGIRDAAEALAEARRWLRDWRAADGSRPYSHPVYWAGFLLVDGGLPGRRPGHAGFEQDR